MVFPPPDARVPCSEPMAPTSRSPPAPAPRRANPRSRRVDGRVVAGHGADRGRHPRRALPRPPARREGPRRGAGALAARADRERPPRLPRGRRGPDHHRHLQRLVDLARRLRARADRAGAEPRRPRSSRGGWRTSTPRATRRSPASWSATSVRCPKTLSLSPRRERPRVPLGDLRPGARRLRRAGARGLLEGGSDLLDHRDDLRHA